MFGYAQSGLIAAPAPVGLSGWINAEPLGVPDFIGKVALFDFWTYTCVNCIRTLPYLREWHDKYADLGLLIVGVHTPEFEFEKLRENVSAAAESLGVEYAVAQDNDMQTWRAYRVEAWPTKYIMDGDGFVRYYRRGEGGYADTEAVIRFLLEEMGRDVSGIEPRTDADPTPIAGTRATDPERFITREMYGGAKRNIDYGGAYILNEEFYESPYEARVYVDDGERKNHFLFLNGEWRATDDAIRHTRASPDFADYIGFRFFANEVNAVLGNENGEPFEFRLTMDGAPIPPEFAGADVSYDDAGNSVVRVVEPRMYRLARMAEVESRELLLMPADSAFSLYSATFGAYSKGED